MTFDYDNAFSRNIGWVTKAEQASLRHKKVAIAGAGGVGGEHMITLARMGITQFHIADFDDFEEHNFNRQAGATVDTLQRPKIDVMAEMIRAINPDAEVTVFAQGVFPDNVDVFFSGVDVYIDALDFFAMDAREMVFAHCHQHDIPVVTAAPLGLGTALLCFTPESMDYETYFNFSRCHSKEEKLIKFLVGLSPSLLQKGYLVVPESADFVAEKGPSMCPSVKLCAGYAATYVFKILLNRPGVLAAPHGLHFDAYRNKFKHTWCPFGNRGPLQRLKYMIAKKLVSHR